MTHPNVQCKTRKLLKDDRGENLSDPGYGDKFLDATHTKGMKRKGKIIRLDCIKI